MSPIAWPAATVFDDSELRRRKNHSSKSALRVMQRAIEHRKRACATKRCDMAFILSHEFVHWLSQSIFDL
jgi:hypothetical protein